MDQLEPRLLLSVSPYTTWLADAGNRGDLDLSQIYAVPTTPGDDPTAPPADVAVGTPFTQSFLSEIGVEQISWNEESVYAHGGRWILTLSDMSGPVTQQISFAQDYVNQGLTRSGLLPGDATSSPLAVTRNLNRDGVFLLETDQGYDYDTVMGVVADAPGFAGLEPDFLLWSDAVPNDPEYHRLWGLHNTGQTGGTPDADIDAQEAWDISTGGAGIVVGVIDTGVDYNHPDLAANMWTNPGETPGDGIDNDGNGFVDDYYGWDFAYDDSDPMDFHSHGTHCSGTIAGIGNNATGVVGVNWDAKIMAIKFLNDSGSGSTADGVDSVNYATMMARDYGVNIRLTSNSWGGGGYSSALEDAIERSGTEGDMLFVAAAGNNYGNNNDVSPHYPSSYGSDNIIAVASTTHTDAMSNFSNYGPTSVDIGAPGSDVYSTVPGGYGTKSGTSMATPHVSGVAALAFSLAPNATYTEVRNAIFAGADPIPSMSGKVVTDGRLNAYNTLMAMGLSISSSSPADGDVVHTLMTDYTITFADDIDTSSVDATDLVVNGVAADSFTVDSADTVTWSFSASPISAEGPQTMELPAGAISRSTDGLTNTDFAVGFRYDATPMAVVSTNPTPGSTVTAPLTAITMDFNEAVDASSIGTDDLVLSRGTVVSATALDGDTIEFQLSGIITEEALNATVPAGALLDAYGNPFPADYTANYFVDVGTIAYPTPLEAKLPPGSLIYDPSYSGAISTAGDTDSFTIDVDAGQTMTVIVTADDGTLQTIADVYDPSGGLAASVTAGAPGEAAIVQTLPTAAAGQYTVTLSGAASTTGQYTIQLMLNAAGESESVGGASNDTPATAQDIDSSFLPMLGSSARGAVRGVAEGTDYYSFTAAAGERISLVIAGDNMNGGVQVELTDAAGNLLAKQLTGADNVDGWINGFTSASGGTYLAKVDGTLGVGYSLLVIKNAGFDLEENNAIGNGQAMVGDGMLGDLTTSGGPGIEPDDYASGTILTNVVPGITLTANGSPTPVTSITDSNSSTGSRVFGYGGSPHWNSSSATLRADFISPVDEVSIDIIPNDSSDPAFLRAYDAAGNLVGEDLVPSSTVPGQVYPLSITRPPADIAYILASGQGGDTVQIDNLAISGFGGGDDVYLLNVTAGDTINLETATPGDGPNEFVNDLDPAVELYAPDGSLVAADDNSAGDGRNAKLTMVATTTGIYAVRVHAMAGTEGEYFLSATGATGATTGMTVTSTTPADGSVVTNPVTSIIVDFSKPVLASSLDPSDMLFDGQPALAATLLDGDSAEFTVPAAIIGGHVYEILAGSVEALDGATVDPFVGSFHLPLERLEPDGSLMYRSKTVDDVIATSGEVKSYPVNLAGGQTTTVVVDNVTFLTLTVELLDDAGTVLGSATATAPGDSVMLPNVAIPASGLYEIRLSDSTGATGGYSLHMLVNTYQEAEELGGGNNDSPGTAEDLDPAFTPIAGSADRAGVQGVGQAAISDDYYSFTLADGESASLGISGDSLNALRLLDSGGNVVAAGTDGRPADLAINDFIALGGEGGTYFVQVSADGDYGLVITRNASFDTGVDTGVAGDRALDISATGAVLGYAGKAQAASVAADDPHKVAVLSLLNSSIRSNLAAAGFDAETVSVSEVESGWLLTNEYDVFVTGRNYIYTVNQAFVDQVMAFVDEGNGLVTEWDGAAIVYDGYHPDYRYSKSNPQAGFFHADIGGGDSLGYTPLTQQMSHDIWDGLPASFSGSTGTEFFYTSYNYDPADIDIIATYRGNGSSMFPAIDFPAVFTLDGYNVVCMPFDWQDNPNDANLKKLYTNAVAWAAENTGGPNVFSVEVNAGDVLVIETSTPGDGPFGFANSLDPVVELYDPAGNLVASDDNSGGDGRNARLTYTATTGGSYIIDMGAVGMTGGEYLLSVTGATAGDPAFEVAVIDPADGAKLPVAPTKATIEFSDHIRLSSVDATDLLIDGSPAAAVTVVDARTLEFDLPTLAPGVHTLTLAAGALTDLQGTGLAAFSSTVELDLFGPRVIASSITDGDVVSPGALTYTVQFDEPIEASNLDVGDFRLHGIVSGAMAPDSFTYDAGTSTLILEFSGLIQDDYALTVYSGDGQIEDLLGHDLDGEPLAVPVPPYLSGDGNPGGDWFVNFAVDTVTEPLPTPMEAVTPNGAMVYTTGASGVIAPAGDTDAFTLSINSGQTITVIADPNGTLAPSLTLTAPDGSVIATATAPGAGQAAVIQLAAAALDGEYSVEVGGDSATTGAFDVTLMLNVAVEEETYGGPNNDTPGTAQDLDAATIAAGSMQRAAVAGTLPVGGYLPVESEDWESGTIGGQWSTWSSTGDGRIRVIDTYGGAESSQYAAWMDRYSSGSYNLNELIWTVNLAGVASPMLSFWQAEYGDEEEIMPATFTGHSNSDGVAISGDGNTWHRVWEVTGQSDGAWEQYEVDLAAAAAGAGIDLNQPLMIKFQQYDNYDLTTDGRAYDQIMIGTPDTGDDWYSFSLAANESASVVSKSASDGAGLVQLYDSAGQLVTMSTNPDTGEVDGIIDGFQPGVAGTYFIKATGFVGDYQIVVMKDGTFDVGTGDQLADAQPLSATGRVLGALAGQSVPAISSETEPNDDGVPGGSLADLQLANDWSGSFAPNGPDRYDAMLTGTIDDSSDRDWDFFKVLASPGDTLEIELRGSYYGNGTLGDPYLRLFDQNGNQIAANDDYFGLDSFIRYQNFSYVGDYYAVADGLGSSTGTYKLIGRHLTTSQLFEIDSEDLYRFEVNAGDSLAIATETPGDGPYAFGNVLDPKIELYDPSGALVASDDNSGGDGRNASLNHTALATGTYVVKIMTVSNTTGEYVLTASGYTGSTGAFTVTATDPADGAEVPVAPSQITVDFSSPVQLTTLDASDLTIDGLPATGVTVVDGDTARFDIPLGVKGSHAVEIAAGSIIDLNGTPIDAYLGSFTNPIEAIEPLGGLVYDPAIPGQIANPGDVQSFVITLDAGNTVTVVADPDPTLEAGLTVKDASGNELATGAGNGAGLDAVVQTVEATSGGRYTIDVTGLVGTVGNYELQLVINAAVEAEEHDGGRNDDIASAQDLDGSFLALAGGGQRGAVRGVADSGAYSDTVREDGNLFYPNTVSLSFTGVDPAAAGDAVLTIRAQADLGATSEFLTLDIEGLFTEDVFVNDGNEGGIGTTMVTVPMSDLAAIVADGTVDMSFTASYEVNDFGPTFVEVELAYPTPSTGDFYSFSLGAGQSADVSVHGAVSGLLLLDGQGNVLATGVGGARNVDLVIADFFDVGQGTYYLQVSGGNDYTLLVTRDMSFNIEGESDEDVQDIQHTTAALGHVRGTGVGGADASVKIAVLGGSYVTNAVNQLNDSAVFNFDATQVTSGDIDTLAELNAYDVVVIGDQHQYNYLSAVESVLRDWVEGGGGVVGTGWLVYLAGTSTGSVLHDINAIMPIDTSVGHNYYSAGTIEITDPSHPIMDGLSDFYVGSNIEYSSAGLDAGGQQLAQINGRVAAAVGEYGNGRSVYLGPVFMDNYSPVTSGDPDQLFEQAVWWAGRGIDQVDSYMIKADAGDVLTIRTATPSDGPYTFNNRLDPVIQLYDAAGNLLGTDDNSGGDGRNAELVYTVAVAGEYIIKVTAAGDQGGEYVVTIDGATGAIPPAVEMVEFASSQWSSQFAASVAAMSGGDAGYAIPAGAGQLEVLPWSNVDQFSIRFSRDVQVDVDDLTLSGRTDQGTLIYDLADFTYDPSTFTATWSVNGPIGPDRLTISLDDELRDSNGNKLDGEWDNAVSSFASGDGLPGGDFVFKVNILPGDVDRSGYVNVMDVVQTFDKQFTRIGMAGYDAMHDVDGSGWINALDVVKVRDRQFGELPPEAPLGGLMAPDGLTVGGDDRALFAAAWAERWADRGATGSDDSHDLGFDDDDDDSLLSVFDVTGETSLVEAEAVVQ